MRVEPLHSNDRLFLAAAGREGNPVQLELSPGICLEHVSGGHLQFADGRGAWVSALSLALHLGWCRRLSAEAGD